MSKKITPLAIAMFITVLTALPCQAARLDQISSIKRLTFSGNSIVKHPCLSQDGRLMLYTMESQEGEEITRSIHILDLEKGEEKELFRDGITKAPMPYDEESMRVGTKPPLLSGDGTKAVFALSLNKSFPLLDHFLAIVDIQHTEVEITSFPIDALKDKDFLSLGFESGDWERISNYAISSNGERIACVVKGHLGPGRFGQSSGIVLIDVPNKTQSILLAPEFSEEAWRWSGFPRRPLTGGGWAFGLSDNGENVLFGAQSSEDKNDYDIYVAKWGSNKVQRITDFHDRWFSLADISTDGQKIAFFYTGKQKQGIGTYTINSDGTGLKQLESNVAPRIEFLDMSGDGRYVVFKHIYTGMILDLRRNTEKVAYNEDTQGYVHGVTPMEFPPFPSFWNPQIVSLDGKKSLLIGPPMGKETSEIYLLQIGTD